MRSIIDLQHVLHGELRVTLRGRQAFVAEQFLNGAKIGAFLQHVSSKSMAQGVRMHIGRKPLRDRNAFDNASDAARGKCSSSPVDEQRNGALTAVD